MDRECNGGERTPSEDITNTTSRDNNINGTPVLPNSNGRTRQTMTEEQKRDVRRARDRARYAKKNPIPKRARKDNQALQAMNFGPSDAQQGVSTNITAIESAITQDRAVDVGADNSGKENADPIDGASWLHCDDYKGYNALLDESKATGCDVDGMMPSNVTMANDSAGEWMEKSAHLV